MREGRRAGSGAFRLPSRRFRKLVDVSESRLVSLAKNVSVLDESVSVQKVLSFLNVRNLPSVQQAALYASDSFKLIDDGGGQASTHPHFTVRNEQGAVAERGSSIIGDFWQRRKAFFDVEISDCHFIRLGDRFPDIFDRDIEEVDVGLPFVRGNGGLSRLPCWTKFRREAQRKPYDPRPFTASEVRALGDVSSTIAGAEQ